jgi:hypothetical protein
VCGHYLTGTHLVAANQFGHLDSAQKADIRTLGSQELRCRGSPENLAGLAASHGPFGHAEFYHLTGRLRRDNVY